jgi:hypothetical protein
MVKILKKAFLFILLMIIFISISIAGPFGLEKSMLLKDIRGKKSQVGNGVYMLDSVPKPHSAFKTYYVRVAPKGGLYWIKAIGKDVSTSNYGIELKAVFNCYFPH